MQSYLSERKQINKINQAYSSWEQIHFGGTPRDLYLVRFHLIFFLSDLLLVVQNVDFGSYADDNIIYDAGDNIDEVLFSLQESAEKLFKRFADNEIKTSEGKCHLTVSTNKLTEIQLGDNSDSEKFLGE